MSIVSRYITSASEKVFAEAETVNPEFFEDENDVRTYANKAVGELLWHYPKVSVLLDVERAALHMDAVEHLTGEIYTALRRASRLRWQHSPQLRCATSLKAAV